MQISENDTQVQIEFGAGGFDKLADIIGGRNYCAVTYGEPYFAALLDRLGKMAGPPMAVVDDVAPNPDFALLGRQVDRISALGKKPEIILAIGGGSVIDTAKVLASANGDFANVENFLVSGAGEDILDNIPIIAVPTTSGTGSEVTCWATVWDKGSGKKYSLNRTALYPQNAVIDPELMLAKPQFLTLSTGLDALSHALESIWNVNASPESISSAVSAAREILDVLPVLVNDLGSLELRSRMAAAALMSGIAFSKTKTAIAHSISYPITLEHQVAHGIACSFTLPIVLQSVSEDRGLCGASLRQIFGDDLKAGARQLGDFLKGLGIALHPIDYGVAPDEWRALVDTAFSGERGLNFIGSQDNFNAAAKLFGVE